LLTELSSINPKINPTVFKQLGEVFFPKDSVFLRFSRDSATH